MFRNKLLELPLRFSVSELSENQFLVVVRATTIGKVLLGGQYYLYRDGGGFDFLNFELLCELLVHIFSILRW